MIIVELTEREASIVAALLTHHVNDMTVSFVEGTATWTTQLTVDPNLAGAVIGTVNDWIRDAKNARHKIYRAATAAHEALAGMVPVTETEGVQTNDNEE